VFIEVKTGRSVLSAREKAVKKAVEGKKVSWRVFNPDVEVIRPVIPKHHGRLVDTGATVIIKADASQCNVREPQIAASPGGIGQLMALISDGRKSFR
jgi:hypothetical protein